MPIPQIHGEIEPVTQKLPQAEVSSAIEKALTVAGALSEKQELISETLTNAGLGITECAFNIAALALHGKEATRLKATERAIELHGIPLSSKAETDAKPTVVFNIHSENTNLNNLFAPQRT